MFKNYVKIAIRNFTKQKHYSIISILGFAIGISCCLLILLYVKHEYSYDSFYPNADRIYRVATEVTSSQGKSMHATTPVPLGPVLKAENPEIEHITRMFFSSDHLFEHNEKRFFEDSVVFVDPEFFDVFPLALLKGNPAHLLDTPNSLVLTAAAAEKYFGNRDPVGQSIRIDRNQEFKITGVIANIPENAHFHFDFAISFLAKNEKNFGTWLKVWTGLTTLYTYAVLPESIDMDQFTSRVENTIVRHSEKRPGVTRKIFFQPLRSIYLHSHLEDEIEQNNFASNLIILSTIAFLILIIACINYMNLATSQSAKRAKEVGMRKVMGAEGWQIVKQFIGESICLCTISLFISLLAVEILLIPFSSLVGKSIEYNLPANLPFLGIFILTAIITGALSSLYPALYLSRHQPVRAIKGMKETARSSTGQIVIKKVLVVGQFTVSILLIICTFMINKQLHFMRTAHLGFDKEHTIVIPFSDEASQKHYQSLKDTLLTYRGVISATACLKPPIGSNVFITRAFPKGKEAGISFTLYLNAIDFDFIDSFGIEMAAGRNIHRQYSTDAKTAMIVNEAAVRELGYSTPEDALGTKLKTGFYGFEGTITGVTKDHHIASFHEEIAPMAMVYRPEYFYTIAAKIQTHDIQGTLSFIEETWTRIIPEYPFIFSFLNEDIDRLYRAEEQTAKIIRTFSIIAIFIACMGLFGLSAHTAERRTKEIGIRKVLGATVSNLIVMLSSEFTKWVLIANSVAWPVAYLATYSWLQNFAYRTSIKFWVFVFAAGLAFLISLMTVSYQAIKAAVANPIDSLRYE